MKLKKAASILTALSITTLTCTASFAADEKNRFSARGVGGEKCETLVNIIESNDEKQLSKYVPIFIGWVDGYISYINRIENNTYNVVPFISGPEILALITQQCKKKPETRIEETVNHTVSVLAKYKIKKESPAVNVVVEKNSGIYYKETIIDIQSKLNKLGYYKDKLDGSYNENTIKAMKIFQKSQNLTESGFPNIDTLLRLLYN